MAAPRPAARAPRAELEELLGLVRRDLLRRGESPSGEWVTESVDALRSGAKSGWFVPLVEGGGLAFFARRGPEAYGHVHLVAGPGAVARGEGLVGAMVDGLPADVRSINVGFTGLSIEDERVLAGRVAMRPGSTVIEREAMERTITEADGERSALPPDPLRQVPVRDVTLEALADLDQRSFRGSIDELLLGPRVEEYRRVIGAILDGSLWRLLDEASTALVTDAPVQLVGALLTTERTAREAAFVDLMVDPELRRKGYGRFLMGWGLRALRALGYERVRLWVTVANAPARALYARFDFRRVASATLYRWERSSAPPQPQPAR